MSSMKEMQYQFSYKDYISKNTYEKFKEMVKEIIWSVTPGNINEWETLAKLGELVDVNKNEIEVIYLSDDELNILDNKYILGAVYDEKYRRYQDQERSKECTENFYNEFKEITSFRQEQGN